MVPATGRSLGLLSVVLLLASATAQKPGGKAETPRWDRFAGGIEASVPGGDWVVRTTLAAEQLPKMVARIAELRPFYEAHFGTKLGKGWTFVVLTDMGQYNTYARETSRGRLNVQGQCLREQKSVVVCDSQRYGWNTTLSHEFAHAYYDCNGPIWLREGVASLVEVAEADGKTMRIPVNGPRRNGLVTYQQKGHYGSIQHLLKGEPEPDGYGYSYEHGWSVHYWLYGLDAAKYRAFLAAVRSKTGRDLSPELEKAFGMDLATMDARWREFVAKLQ